jgi:NAD(P)-dependent dehydrogenase (short-subunit alcohol dehydrogenase family)
MTCGIGLAVANRLHAEGTAVALADLNDDEARGRLRRLASGA